MTPWPPEPGVRTVAYYSARARSRHDQTRGATMLAMLARLGALLRRLRRR